MKLVINRCFGGFGLSQKAIEDLSRRGVKTFTFEDQVPKEDEGLWVLLNDKDSQSNSEDHRTDPRLLQVVETLGKEANTLFSQLHIVDIPEDVDYYIDDHDGVETVREKSRSWH